MALLLSLELGAMTVSTQGLVPHQVSGELRVTDPALHFLTGKSLALLHDGAAVPFDFQLTVASGSEGNVVARSLERFMVSYDVWEEKFSVVRVRDFRKSGHAPFRIERRILVPGQYFRARPARCRSASSFGRTWKSGAWSPESLWPRVRGSISPR